MPLFTPVLKVEYAPVMSAKDGWVTDRGALRAIFLLQALQPGDEIVETMNHTDRGVRSVSRVTTRNMEGIYWAYDNDALASAHWKLLAWRRPT